MGDEGIIGLDVYFDDMSHWKGIWKHVSCVIRGQPSADLLTSVAINNSFFERSPRFVFIWLLGDRSRLHNVKKVLTLFLLFDIRFKLYIRDVCK